MIDRTRPSVVEPKVTVCLGKLASQTSNHGEEVEVDPGPGREPQDEAIDGWRADSGGGPGACPIVTGLGFCVFPRILCSYLFEAHRHIVQPPSLQLEQVMADRLNTFLSNK